MSHRHRSYAFLLCFLLVLTLVLAAAMWRCGLVQDVEPELSQALVRRGASPAATAVSQGTPRVAQRATPTITVALQTSTSQKQVMPTPAQGSQSGLVLRSVRPLSLDAGGIRGLAASAEFLYIASTDSYRRQATVYQVRWGDLAVVRSRSLHRGTLVHLGGMQMGKDLLWASLSQDTPTRRSLILGLDPRSLDPKQSFAVSEQIIAVAQGDDEMIYGLDADGSFFSVWTPNGDPIQRSPNPTGIRYADLEIVRGRVVGGGVVRGDDGRVGGVIDVIDALTFELKARHYLDERAPGGRWVTENPFAFWGEGCHFVEDSSPLKLMSFALSGFSWSEFVP